VVTPFAAPQAVSTETPLFALTQFGDKFSDIVFTLRNHDAVNKAALYIDRSASGIVSAEDRQIVYISPLHERSFELRDVMWLYWGLSASGDPDAAFPSVNVSWQVLARIRAAPLRAM
jgi:hypothetical protein